VVDPQPFLSKSSQRGGIEKVRDLKPMALVSAWFGPWPAWMPLYLESVRANRDVDWILVSDQPPPDDLPVNVSLIGTSLSGFLDRIGRCTGLDLSAIDAPYKLCDLKPTYGHVFQHELSSYRSYGHADIDVIFGDLRHFYTDEVLDRYDVISTHTNIISGHLAVFRNSDRVRLAYQRIRNWEALATDPNHHSLDEVGHCRVYRSRGFLNLRKLLWQTMFREQFSTPDARLPWRDGSSKWPATWYWNNGHLNNSADPGGCYPYLHFMAWHSNRYRDDGNAPWPQLERLAQVTATEARANGFTISPRGFMPLEMGRLGRQSCRYTDPHLG
jgi:hypothetical protein